MKRVQIPLRLGKCEHEKTKCYAKKHKLTFNQVIRDLIAGKRCFCPQHDFMPGNVDKSGKLNSERLFDNLQFTYEVLLLLRELVNTSNPGLIDIAISNRQSYFEPKNHGQTQEDL